MQWHLKYYDECKQVQETFIKETRNILNECRRMHNIIPYCIADLVAKPVVTDEPLQWDWPLRRQIEDYTLFF